ncbi:aspartate/glutamate racemase family protein [Hoeflea olei]|uniref:Aspartate racemase n=1 Tax=Hoeflea olei TaxID=1480615 RepID=A0A1C1YZW7_9HYPH|nr:amino acid racemase [Hoeflea olei]OCW59048.1 hypothetical protein AWJ14_04915 [Hoeflea olei]
MQLIGLLGGLSPEAVGAYYRIMNDYTRKALGDGRSARILLHSIDSGDAEGDARDRSELDSVLTSGASSLKAGGADFFLAADRRIHQVAEGLAAASGLDLLHIADPVGAEMKKDGCTQVALFGTQQSAEDDYFSDRLASSYGISVIAPDEAQSREMERILTEEVAQGILHSESRAFAAETIVALRDRGAQAVVIECALIGMIVPPDSDVIPAYDATRLHARAAVRRAIGGNHG